MSVYLDYNASNPIDNRILEEMISVYTTVFGNPDSRTHEHGTAAQLKIQTAREQVASLLGIMKNEVVFTSGATESDNMAILGLADYGIANKKNHIITTAIEHKAILEPLKVLGGKGFKVDYIYPNESGRINADELLKKVTPETLLVSISHANNETGVIQPVAEIGEMLSKTEVFFHIDAAQTCGKLVDELKTTKYDMLTIAGHKMYGPQGVGALILRVKNYKKPPIKPLMFGGGQEGGLRPGTLPVALIAGLGKACDIAANEYAELNNKCLKTKNTILSELQNSGVSYEINGDQKYCMPNTLNVSFIGVDSEALMLATKQYCSFSNGSACTSHSYSPSHVLSAMGLSDERIESAIRMSWGPQHINIAKFNIIFEAIKLLC